MQPTAEQLALMAKMREAATGATQPSPWEAQDDGNDRWVVLDANDLWVADVGAAPEDAKHIATASPSNTLALLAIIDGLLRENEHYRLEILRLDVEIAKARHERAQFSQAAVVR